MKRRYFSVGIIGIIAIMIIFNVIFLIRIANIHPSSTEQNLHAELHHMLCEKIFIQYQSENSVINNMSGNIEQNEKIDLKSLLSDRLTLIFRYNENDCSACVEEALKPLMEFSTKMGIRNILIITSSHNVRTMNIFIRQHAPGIHVFNSNEDINLPVEKWDTPYFFLIDNSLRVKLVFIPVKEIQNYTWEYLNIIYQRYFNF
jgi:hypothetical protein